MIQCAIAANLSCGIPRQDRRIARTSSRLSPNCSSSSPNPGVLRCRRKNYNYGEDSLGLACMVSKRWRKRIIAATGEGENLGSPGVIRKKRPPRPVIPEYRFHVLLQGFNWESQAKKPWYEILKTKAAEIQAAGFTDVWFPPPSQSVDKHGYLPTQLYDLNSSSYGNEAQLRDCIDVMHTHNICCIADVVINHRSGWKQDSTGHWNMYEGGTNDRRLDWGPWALVSNDIYDSGGKGSKDSGESYGAAPDLDHSNKQVQDELTDWMNWMRAEIGFDGWRFDFVKGYSPIYTKI